MTYRHGAWLFGTIVLVALFASEYGGFSHTRLGTAMWLVGLVVLTVVSPIWGFCLGRCHTGRGDKRFRVWR